MKTHYTHSYILSPQHKVTVNLIGCGGTGSRVLTNLAIMDKSLMALGHPGIHVTAFDDDNVSTPNIGRQAFLNSDLGLNKAQVMVNRVNRMLGLQWDYYPFRFEPSLIRSKSEKFLQSNILISCVDTLESRKMLKSIDWNPSRDYENPLYWLDIGNGKNYGQYILSTLQYVEQHSDGVSVLKDIFEIHPDVATMEEDESTPSCSLAEALTKQDLFVNPTMAIMACHLLWRLMTEGKITYQGAYVNMDTMQTNLIKL